MFSSLLKATSSYDEKALLIAAVSDYKRFEGIDDATQIIYEKRFPHTGAPFFPFLEVCNMPLLFSEHDLIKYKGKVYKVSYLPTINKNCDFSDECYTCYPLDGSEHQHIHVCEAESASNSDFMTRDQEVAMERCADFLARMYLKYGVNGINKEKSNGCKVLNAVAVQPHRRHCSNIAMR